MFTTITPLIRPRFRFYFRVIMVNIKNTREVIIIMRKKVINRQRDTIVITNMMRNMVIKTDMHQDINGRNQIIIDETWQILFLYNCQMRFIYVRFVENFADWLYIWNSIEWHIPRVLSLLTFHYSGGCFINSLNVEYYKYTHTHYYI